MKKTKRHWEELPSDDMYELISDVAGLLCWYIFWAKSLPAEEDDPDDLGWDWARNNLLHQPDQFYKEFLVHAMAQPLPLHKSERIVDLLQISMNDMGNIRTAVEMALEWFNCKIITEPYADGGFFQLSDGILDFVEITPIKK